MIRRLPIRLRLTLTFTSVMALVLLAAGAFVYLRLAAELDETIDQGLRSRAIDLTALLREEDSLGARGGRVVEQEETFAQALSPTGEVIDSTPQLSRASLLDPAEIAAARRAPTLLDRESGGALQTDTRLLATSASAEGRPVVLVVGASLEDRGSALSTLATLLIAGGAGALVLASVAGYGVAAAALRPVESMRRQAADVSPGKPGQRLPVPPARDEIARLGRTLNEMLERQERAFERQEAALARERTFVSDASHELRTPLALVRSELEVALRGDPARDELLEAIRSASEETERLSQLAEDLLVIARSDQGRLPIRREPVSVAELFGDVRERFRRRFEQAGRSVALECPDGPRIDVDRIRIEQALGNMLENALRHGGGTVTLRCERQGDVLKLHVLDDGPGFAGALVDTAFERFTRADASRSRGGAGLGLAIVDAIARAHGGSAGVAERAGAGADVWLAVPCETAERVDERGASRAQVGDL